MMLTSLRDRCVVRHEPAGAPLGNPLNVVFGVDLRFARHAMVTLLSVLEANPGRGFHFHFISFDSLGLEAMASLPADHRQRCAASSYQVPAAVFAALPESRHFPKSACLRLLAPFLLGCETALYLDADIVCLAPLDGLLPALSDAETVVAVVDDCAETTERQVPLLGLSSKRYFNSGMLYLHIGRWLSQGITEQVLGILREKGGVLRFPDQDALNTVLEGKCRYVAGRYNQQFTLGHGREDALRQVPAGTVFVHYSGVDKPWQAWNEQAAVVHYRRLRARLPWASEPYDLPTTGRQARRLYKLSFRRGRWLTGCVWLVRRWKAARSKARA